MWTEKCWLVCPVLVVFSRPQVGDIMPSMIYVGSVLAVGDMLSRTHCICCKSSSKNQGIVRPTLRQPSWMERINCSRCLVTYIMNFWPHNIKPNSLSKQDLYLPGLSSLFFIFFTQCPFQKWPLLRPHLDSSKSAVVIGVELCRKSRRLNVA